MAGPQVQENPTNDYAAPQSGPQFYFIKYPSVVSNNSSNSNNNLQIKKFNFHHPNKTNPNNNNNDIDAINHNTKYQMGLLSHKKSFTDKETKVQRASKLQRQQLAIDIPETTPFRHHQHASSSLQVEKSASEIEIIDEDQAQTDVEQGEGGGNNRHRHRHSRSRPRPLYRRLFNYIKEAWTGVSFSSSNDSELEELETPPRYRPDSLSALCRVTRFSEAELKRIYRGFKAECPTGMVREDTFKVIYSQFFPQGANSGLYAHYVFNTLDPNRTGIVSFEDFVLGLSILSRGSLEERLRWTFSLYDINGDGFITREEMTDIVTAIYDLAGMNGHHQAESGVVGSGGGGGGAISSSGSGGSGTDSDGKIKAKVERIFQKMDLNRDGVVTLDEFLECCRHDETITQSMTVFDSSF